MRVYPKSGKKDDLFDRLKEYIDQFDQEGKNNILGTSDEKILELIKYSKVRECGFDLPDDYIIYLKRMGENDGNLLKYSISAETNINEVIDLYLYYEEEPDETIDPEKILIGFNSETSIVYQMEIRKGKSIYIGTEDGIEGGGHNKASIISTTFEKFMFQSAMKRYEKRKLPYSYYFAISKIDVDKVIAQLQQKDIYSYLDKLCQKYLLVKSWLTDEWNYIAMSEKSTLYLEYEYRIQGFISSYNLAEIKEIAKDINNLLLIPDNEFEIKNNE